MKSVVIFLIILLVSACTTDYVYLNTCIPDICIVPETVEDYIIAYECKSKIVESCKKKPLEN